MVIEQDLIPKGRKNRPGRANPMLYITLHDTGNTSTGADARAHAKYLKSDAAVTAQVSWHYSVDDTRAVQHIPDNEDAWHAGDGAGDGNRKSIGIEVCINRDGNRARAFDNAAALCARLCRIHGIPVNRIVQHNYWNGKNCPKTMRGNDPYSFAVFLSKVRTELEGDNMDTPSAWAKEAWDKAKQLGITDGSRPRDPATREEVVLLLLRALGKV